MLATPTLSWMCDAAYAQGGASASAAPSEPELPPPLQPGSAEAAVYQTLRTVRRELAHERRLPAYHVATNRALAWLAWWRPNHPAALLELPGWGPALRARSGDALWQAMADAAAAEGLPLQPIPPLHEGRPAPPAALAAWALMDRRLPLAEVGAQVGRAASTVHSYWLTWLQRNRPTTLAPWLDDADWLAIADAIDAIRAETGLRRLAPVHERLGGRFDYGTLRAVAVLGRPPAS